MNALRSKQDAQYYLRKCLQGIPAAHWVDIRGEDISHILQELEVNVTGRCQSSQRLYTSVRRRLAAPSGPKPTPIQLFALCLHQGPRMIGDAFLRYIWERDLTHVLIWHKSDPSPPASTDDIEVWREWFKTVWDTFWPSAEDLWKHLSPEKLSYRQMILGIMVKEVTEEKIDWRVPPLGENTDAGYGERHLEQAERHISTEVEQLATTNTGTASQHSTTRVTQITSQESAKGNVGTSDQPFMNKDVGSASQQLITKAADTASQQQTNTTIDTTAQNSMEDTVDIRHQQVTRNSSAVAS